MKYVISKVDGKDVQTPHGKLIDANHTNRIALPDTPENRAIWEKDPSKIDQKSIPSIKIYDPMRESWQPLDLQIFPLDKVIGKNIWGYIK